MDQSTLEAEIMRLEATIESLQETVDVLKGNKISAPKKNYIKGRKSKLIGVRLDLDVFDILSKTGKVSTQVNAICREYCGLGEYIAEA